MEGNLGDLTLILKIFSEYGKSTVLIILALIAFLFISRRFALLIKWKGFTLIIKSNTKEVCHDEESRSLFRGF